MMYCWSDLNFGVAPVVAGGRGWITVQKLGQKVSQRGQASQICLLQLSAVGSLDCPLPQELKDRWVKASHRLPNSCTGLKSPTLHHWQNIYICLHHWTGAKGNNGCGRQDNYFPFLIPGPPTLSFLLWTLLLSNLHHWESPESQFLYFILPLYYLLDKYPFTHTSSSP